MPEIKTNPTTISSAIGSKAIGWVNNHSFYQICVSCASVAVFAFGWYAMLKPQSALHLALFLLEFRWYLLPRLAVLAFVVFRFRKIIRWIGKATKAISAYRHRFDTPNRAIAGVPAAEIINFLFEFGCFPANDTISRFGINSHAYQKIVAELSNARLIVRGDNNSWIRNPKISRSAAAAFLHTSNPPLRICNNGVLTYRSAAEEVAHSADILESLSVPENA